MVDTLHKLLLFKLDKRSLALPVKISVFQRSSVLVWDDVLEHLADSVVVAVVDIWRAKEVTSILVPLQVSWESVFCLNVIDILDVTFIMFVVLLKFVHNSLVDFSVNLSREHPNWLVL